MVRSSYEAKMDGSTFMSAYENQARRSDVSVLQIGVSGRSERKKGPFLVVVYQTERKSPTKSGDEKSAVFRCRHIPVFVDNVHDEAFSEKEQQAWIDRTMRRLENHPRHSILIHQVPKPQLQRLLLHILEIVSGPKDNSKGSSSQESIQSQLPILPQVTDTSQEAAIPDGEDLNKLDDAELAERKARMDVIFNKNRITPDSPSYVYDLRVDFDASGAEKQKDAIWDDEN